MRNYLDDVDDLVVDALGQRAAFPVGLLVDAREALEHFVFHKEADAVGDLWKWNKSLNGNPAVACDLNGMVLTLGFPSAKRAIWRVARWLVGRSRVMRMSFSFSKARQNLCAIAMTS